MNLNTNLKTKNLDVDEELKEYLIKRIKKFEKFIDDEDTSAIADIELGRTTTDQRSGKIFRAEINLKVAGGYYRAEEEAEAIRDAIDEVSNEMTRELRDAKEKKQSRIREGARKMKEMLRGWYSGEDNQNGNST